MTDPTAARPHVLVADDEAIAALALERFLTRRGFRVSTAGNGLDALERYNRDPADVVVTDIRMPRCGGKELIEKLRANNPDLPIVVTTGYMSVSDEAGLTPGDRLVVLQKPIDIEQLLRILRKFTGPAAAE
jgi:DNA-binding NtrC family response regulator